MIQSLIVGPGGFGLLLEGPNLSNARGKNIGEGRKMLNIPEVWLRDNCKCSSCINKDTKQRNFDTFQIPRVHAEKGGMGEEGMTVTWSDGHLSFYPWEWLAHIVVTNHNPISRYKNARKFWDTKVLSQIDRPEVAYEDCMGDGPQKGPQAMYPLMQHLLKYGFCFVTNTPITPEATEKLLEKVGPIRNTHYGGFYDFIPDLASADTAYTNLALAPHTDTTYFTEPAGLQAFHMLSHESPPGQTIGNGELGGQSILVDGFNVANVMRKLYPKQYKTLCDVPVAWHASGNADASITPDKRYPVIEKNGDEQPFTTHRVRWNNDDRGVVPIEHAEEWYEAARVWDSILKRQDSQYQFQLEPGSVLIFDNWRVLHGRKAFEGLRRICGAYISRDDFHSRCKISQHSQSNPDYIFNYNQFQNQFRETNKRRRGKGQRNQSMKEAASGEASPRDNSSSAESLVEDYPVEGYIKRIIEKRGEGFR